MAGIKAVIFDFGGVISTAQVKEEIMKMEELAGAGREDLWAAYWQYRHEYDLGLAGKEYWKKVLSACGAPWDDAPLAQLVMHDTRSWTALNREMLAFVERLKAAGYKLGLLSNMPPDILEYMKKNFAWLRERLFDSTVFSCEIRGCKPDPAVYRKCLRDLQLNPEEGLFVDDLEINVRGARAVGLRAIRYTTFPGFLAQISGFVFNI